MKSLLRVGVIAIIVSFLISSCSVEKRHFLSGYHVVWNKSNKKEHKATKVQNKKNDLTEIKTLSKNETNTLDIKSPSDDIYASTNLKIDIKKKQVVFKNRNRAFECDSITLKDGSIVKGKVEEVGVNDVTYKTCDNLDGQKYIINKSSVASIKYSNGVIDVFNTVENKEKIENKKASKQTNSNTDLESIKKNEPMAIVALFAAVLSIALFIIAYLQFSWIFLLLAGLIAVFGVIYSVIAGIKIKKNKTAFKGKRFVLTALIISILVLNLGALVIVFGFIALLFYGLLLLLFS